MCRNSFNTGSCRYNDCKFKHARAGSHSARSSLANNGTASVNHISELVGLRRQVHSQNEHLAEQSAQIAMLTNTTTSLADELERNSAMMMAAQYSQGERQSGCSDSSDRGGSGAYQRHCNPVFNSQADGATAVNACTHGSDGYTRHVNPVFECGGGSSDIAAVMQVVTRSKVRAKAPSEMERLRLGAKDANVRSPCAIVDGPVIDSATDTVLTLMSLGGEMLLMQLTCLSTKHLSSKQFLVRERQSLGVIWKLRWLHSAQHQWSSPRPILLCQTRQYMMLATP